jgi:hypothetical protein
MKIKGNKNKRECSGGYKWSGLSTAEAVIVHSPRIAYRYLLVSGGG